MTELMTFLAKVVAEGGVQFGVIAVLTGLCAHLINEGKKDNKAGAEALAACHKHYADIIADLQEKRFEDHKALLSASEDAIHANSTVLHTLTETLGRRAS